MVFVFIERLKGLLSISWNQRNTKEKQIVMGLTSIKFRSVLEKNVRKGKGRKNYSMRVPANKQT